MRLLIKLGFWLAVVLMIIPLGSEPGSGDANAVKPADAYAAARETISDLSRFCERQPDVCKTGKAAFETAGVRAKDGAKIAYEFLDKRFGTPSQEKAAPVVPPAPVPNPAPMDGPAHD